MLMECSSLPISLKMFDGIVYINSTADIFAYYYFDRTSAKLNLII